MAAFVFRFLLISSEVLAYYLSLFHIFFASPRSRQIFPDSFKVEPLTLEVFTTIRPSNLSLNVLKTAGIRSLAIGAYPYCSNENVSGNPFFDYLKCMQS